MATTIDAARPRAFEPGMETGIGPSPSAPGWDLATERRLDDGETLARALGWFSIGLGAGQLLAAERLAHWLGMEEKTELIRLYGVREIGQGLGILTQRRPTNWLWARVAGDMLDIGTLATGLTRDNRRRDNVMGAILAVAGVTVLDVIAARQLGGDRYRWDSVPERDLPADAPSPRGAR